MKILQVCPYFYPYLAGQERYVLQLSKKLSKHGENVEVFTTNHLDLPRFELIENISVQRFNMVSAPLNNPISIDFLHAFNKMKSFDIIHIHNEHSFVSFITCLYNIFLKKPIVLTCHGQLKFGSSFKDLFETFYSKTIGRFIFNSATKIISLSEDDKKYIASFGINDNKIYILPNAIDIEYLDKCVSNLEIYNELRGKFVDKRLVLYVGRIIPRKGIEYLIKSIEIVTKKYSDVLFILIGDGEYKQTAEKLCEELGVSDHVLFLTNLSDESLFAYYKLSDIFILPSLSEGLPTTILEAMYFDTPVISTDIPGIRSHFKDMALLIPPKNEHELAEKIIKLFSENELSTAMSINCKSYVLNNYTWDRVSESCLKMYNSIYK
jgi:glycosyltransferase involved in cell wall biosynthesis